MKKPEITPELVKQVVQNPDKISDCREHTIYVKAFDGNEFWVYAEPEGDVLDIKCAGWFVKKEENYESNNTARPTNQKEFHAEN